MGKYGKYTDQNLIRYEDAIQLAYTDASKQNVFLRFKSYQEAFRKGSSDKIVTVYVGLMESADGKRKWPISEDQVLLVPILSISAHLDAVDVIKFQIAVIAFHDGVLQSQAKSNRDYVIEAINAGFKSIDPSLVTPPKLVPGMSLNALQRKLSGLQHACKKLKGSDIQENARLGFTAYFPRPSLMLQEQRTTFSSRKPGKTDNIDTRKIKLIESGLPRPEKFELHDYFEEVAEEDASSLQGQSKTYKYQFVGDMPRVCAYAFRGERRSPKVVKTSGGLLPHVTRTDSFVFRGDLIKDVESKHSKQLDKKTVPPGLVAQLPLVPAQVNTIPDVQVKVKGQWWIIEYPPIPIPVPIPGIKPKPSRFVVVNNDTTRRLEIYPEAKDQDLPKEKFVIDRKRAIDASLGYKEEETYDYDTGKPVRVRLPPEQVITGPDRKQTTRGALDYRKQVRDFYLNLDKYTQKETFKGFISTTTSMAIGKCFGNHYSPSVDDAGYLYAVRCIGGLRLPSSDPKFKRGDNDNTKIKQISPILNFFEQEIAMPGAIWWEHVVGFRINRCNAQGQFLTGPVYLQDRLRAIDPKAFNALFELMSGKAQGPGPTIEPTYKQDQGYQFVPNAASVQNPGALYAI